MSKNIFKKIGITILSTCFLGSSISYAGLNQDGTINLYANTNRIIYVNNDTGSFHGTGSQASPYNDLQEAIKRAEIGDTVKFAENITYRIPVSSSIKSLLIDKNITLDGGGYTLILSGAKLELAADAVIKDLTLEMQIDGNANDAKIYVSGHNLELNNVKFNGSGNSLPTLVAGSLDNRANANNSTIKINSNSNLTFHKILLGDEDSNMDTSIKLIINGRKIKSENGILVGGNHSLNNKAIIETNSELINNIVSQNNPFKTSLIIKDTFLSNANISIPEVILKNSSVSVNPYADISGISDINIEQAGSEFSLSEHSGNFTLNNLSGFGKLVLNADSTLTINNSISPDTNVEIDNNTGIISPDRNYITATLPENVVPNLTAFTANSYRLINRNPHWRLSKINYVNLEIINTEDEPILTKDNVLYIDNEIRSYFEYIKNEDILSNKVLMENPETGTSNDGNINLIQWTAKEVGNIVIDGAKTAFNISWLDNSQEVSYTITKPENKHYTFADGNIFPNENYNKKIVLEGDARFNDITLLLVDDEKPDGNTSDNSGSDANNTDNSNPPDAGNNGNTDDNTSNTDTPNNGGNTGTDTPNNNDNGSSGSTNTNNNTGNTDTPNNGGSTGTDTPNNNDNGSSGSTNTNNNTGNTDTSNNGGNTGTDTPNSNNGSSGSDNTGDNNSNSTNNNTSNSTDKNNEKTNANSSSEVTPDKENAHNNTNIINSSSSNSGYTSTGPSIIINSSSNTTVFTENKNSNTEKVIEPTSTNSNNTISIVQDVKKTTIPKTSDTQSTIYFIFIALGSLLSSLIALKFKNKYL